MSRKDFNNPGHAHFLTFTCYRRKQLLTSETSRRWLADSVNAARDKHSFLLWAYVFMPEHVHMLLHPQVEKNSIASILRDIKGPFARMLSKDMKERNPTRLKSLEVEIAGRRYYRVWQAGGGYDRNLFTPTLLRRALEYIEWNPVRREMVTEPCAWHWSSARARAGHSDVSLRIDDPGWTE